MNDLLKKIQQICRVCLLENSLMFSVLHRGCTNENVSTMIMTCTSVQINLNDNLPQLVCNNCLERLETAYLFKQECERSEETLRKLLKDNNPSKDSKHNESQSNERQNVFNGNEEQNVFNPNEKQNSSDSFTDEVNVSQIVKVEMHIDENEVVEIKSEPIDIEDDDENTDEEIDDGNYDDPDDYDYTLDNKPQVQKFTKITKNGNLIIKKSLLNNNITEPKKIRRRNVFKCIVCNKEFTHHKRYWAHCKTHPNYKCYICWQYFSDILALGTHIENQHSDKIFRCQEDNCNLEFFDYLKYFTHRKDNHNIENYIECIECEKEFNDYEQLDLHLYKHKRSNKHKCVLCSEFFPKKKALESHMQFHEATFKCDQCDRIYTSKIKLDRHLKTHVLSTYICEECGKEYNQKYNLKKHIDVAHKGLKPPKRAKTHLCSHCGQTFSRPVDLTTHIRIHTGSKPFACDKCEYRCHDKNLLRSHVRIHSGVRPYKCEICGKSFGSRSYLTVHTRFHTGYRPYVCSHCPKGFTNSKDLKVHERTHTGVKLYHCQVCNNSFTTLHYLKVHTKKHENS